MEFLTETQPEAGQESATVSGTYREAEIVAKQFSSASSKQKTISKNSTGLHCTFSHGSSQVQGMKDT